MLVGHCEHGNEPLEFIASVGGGKGLLAYCFLKSIGFQILNATCSWKGFWA